MLTPFKIKQKKVRKERAALIIKVILFLLLFISKCYVGEKGNWNLTSPKNDKPVGLGSEVYSCFISFYFSNTGFFISEGYFNNLLLNVCSFTSTRFHLITITILNNSMTYYHIYGFYYSRIMFLTNQATYLLTTLPFWSMVWSYYLVTTRVACRHILTSSIVMTT